jgi:hypothetical protein
VLNNLVSNALKFNKENGIIENITYVFCPPHGTWEVEESLDEVVAELNNYKWNNK